MSVNALLTGSLKYLQAKHIICKDRKHKPAKQKDMIHHCGMLTLFHHKIVYMKFMGESWWVSACPPPQVPSFSYYLGWWNMTTSEGLTALNIYRPMQHKVQCTVAVFMGNTSMIIWTLMFNHISDSWVQTWMYNE